MSIQESQSMKIPKYLIMYKIKVSYLIYYKKLTKLSSIGLFRIIMSFFLVIFGITINTGFAQSINNNNQNNSTWDRILDKDPEWVAKFAENFNSRYEYIGTRDIEGVVHIVALDRNSIEQKGEYFESSFYQFHDKNNLEDGGGILMKVLCDCDQLNVKINFIGTFSQEIIFNGNDDWHYGFGDSFYGRIVKRICNQVIHQNEYISLTKSNGVYYVPVKINNLLTQDFILDSGAADLYISKSLFNKLNSIGAIAENDFIGFANYKDANGKITTNKVYRLKEVKIGNITVNNIDCAISESYNVSNLLGQSLLEKLGNYEIDYLKGQLIIK